MKNSMTIRAFAAIFAALVFSTVSSQAATRSPGATAKPPEKSKALKPAAQAVASAAPVAPIRTKTYPLDSATVHKHYLDGDFDLAIDMLDQGLKEKRPFNHDDSVFIFKHLGVMYAAKYETREKGKYYMHLLLTVEPTARILDMYASDMIYMIFKNIQEEFEASRSKYERAESHLVGNGQSVPGKNGNGTTSGNSGNGDSEKSSKQSSESSHAGYYWAGAAGAVVVAGVAAYFMMSNSPNATVTNHNLEQPK